MNTNDELQQAAKQIPQSRQSIKQLQAKLAAKQQEEEKARQAAINASKAAAVLARKLEAQVKHLLDGAYTEIGRHVFTQYPDLEKKLKKCTTRKEYAPIIEEFISRYDASNKDSNASISQSLLPIKFDDHHRYDYVQIPANFSEKQLACMYAYLDMILIALTFKAKDCTLDGLTSAKNHYLGKNVTISGADIINDFYSLPPDFAAQDILNLIAKKQ